MKKIKRIFALAGAVFLICMYLSTLIFALLDSPLSTGLFQASVASTILIPVLLYAFILAARLLGNGEDKEEHSDKDKKEP